jgi:hypothetical protein
MRSVAEWHRLGMLAGAPRDHSGFFDFHLFWLETRPFVRAIAKRLALRAPASAPPINARLDLLNDWEFLIDMRFTHKSVAIDIKHLA